MDYFYLILVFVLGLAIVAVLVLILYVKREAKKHGVSATEEIVGICAVALDQTVRKNANKEKALAFIKESGKASNEEIRAHLGKVSRQSVVRYLDELEAEGKVEQVGDSGRGVTYRAK